MTSRRGCTNHERPLAGDSVRGVRQAHTVEQVRAAETGLMARVPEGTTSVQFATRLLDEAGVVVTPGTGYGPSGEGYIRLSLTIPDERLEEGVRRIESLRL